MSDRGTHHRIAQGVTIVRACESPFGALKRRPRGTKGLGLKYESDVAKALAARGFRVLVGQWFHFRDAHGWGYCQTDLLLQLGDCVCVLECKLTDTDGARSQLTRLYRPVLEAGFKRPVKCVAVARSLSKEQWLGGVFASLDEALASPLALGPMPPTLHWIGRGPI